MAINKKYPNVVDSENRINLRRILELSKILEAHIRYLPYSFLSPTFYSLLRTCSIFPPNFEKYEQIQNFISGAI